MTKQPRLPTGNAPILSPTFKYVPAAKTDLAKTFARIREQQRLAHLRTGRSASDPMPGTKQA